MMTQQRFYRVQLKTQTLIRYLLLVSLSMSACFLSAAEPELKLQDGWVRASLPGVNNSVGFMTLHNMLPVDVTLVGVVCTVANSCELHQHTHVGGKMRMEKVDRLIIPASGVLKLSTGGYHVMLLGLRQPVQDGQTVELELLLDGRQSVKLDLPVKSVRDEQ